ncbi:hypothetical protein A4X13_0g2742 [Tilletia indica]|uniref:Golgi apparatus membrane protein TVP38 n=1 Tax=Tilletia indica TaxID=43049 RepID=A0A177TBD6_9BASI|nr:hypothetical protein A4X13_0g2742 [Tilletia indica]
MANPYYPPRPNHFGGPAMRYDGSQQPEDHQNPYARPNDGAYIQNAYSYGQPSQFQQGGGGGYYDPYAAAPSAGADPNMSRVSLSDRVPLTRPTPGFALRADGNTPMGYPQRPDSPADGVYPDRAPNWEKLSPAQVKIAKTFPKDLDEEPKSMLQSAKDVMRRWKDFIRWKYWYYYLVILVIIALTVLMTIFHRQIIDWLTPFSKKVKSVSWGWVIPVIIFVVISFPPLFGHEILAILCGVVYGLWIGFAVVCLGTLLGEIANFYAFKTFLQKHAEKYERKNISYGCMAHIVREGGFKVILLARLSAIPGHFTTAVFATVGMSIWMFTLAAVLSLPKQLSIVYLGVAIETSGSGGESTTSKIVKYVVLLLSLIITVWAAHYLYAQMELARPQVQQTLRAKRYTMLSEVRKTEVALTNTVDYERPHTASSADHDDGGMRPLRGDAERSNLVPSASQSYQQGGQPRWNNRWSQSQNRPRNDEAEMQQLPYNQNTAASTSRLMPNAAPLARFESRASDGTADGTPGMGDVATFGGSGAHLGYANTSKDDIGAQQQQYADPAQGRHPGPPQLRLDPHAQAPMEEDAQQRQLTQSPHALSPNDTLSAGPHPTRAPRYQYQSNIGSVYSLQPSSEDAPGSSPTKGGPNPYDAASLPGYSSMAPHAEEEEPPQQSYNQYQPQSTYHQQHQHQQQQQQQQYSQQAQPQQTGYAAGYPQQQPDGAPHNWQSPPLAMQHDLGQRRWNETSPQAF